MFSSPRRSWNYQLRWIFCSWECIGPQLILLVARQWCKAKLKMKETGMQLLVLCSHSSHNLPEIEEEQNMQLECTLLAVHHHVQRHVEIRKISVPFPPEGNTWDPHQRKLLPLTLLQLWTFLGDRFSNVLQLSSVMWNKRSSTLWKNDYPVWSL